jgi:hypothetical protein
MNIQLRNRADQASSAGTKTAIADCDIHPARKGPTDLYPYLANAGTPISKAMASIPIRA